MNQIHDYPLVHLGQMIVGPLFIQGRAAGWEEAAQCLREEAGKAFARSKDAEAQLLRSMADRFDKQAAKRDQYYKESQHPCRVAAFRELEARDAANVTTLDSE